VNLKYGKKAGLGKGGIHAVYIGITPINRQFMANSQPLDPALARTPGLLRRLAAICYDFVLVFGVILLLWTLYYFLLTALLGSEDVGHSVLAQLFWPLALLGMVGFHVWFWTHGGQTLGMKSWRVRVVGMDGRDPAFGPALRRYLWAWVSAAALGLGFVWALFDREGLTWHDRLSGTRLVMTVKRDKKPGLVDAP
jgi:uncharacterized RDD family membrane protein YckC